jgi:hypothetical protein
MAQTSVSMVSHDGTKSTEGAIQAAPRRRRGSKEANEARSITLTPTESELLILRAATVFNGEESVGDYVLKAAVQRAQSDQELFKRTKRPSPPHSGAEPATRQARS